MAQFHETRMGQRFFESDVPALREALATIAKAMGKPPEADAPTDVYIIVEDSEVVGAKPALAVTFDPSHARALIAETLTVGEDVEHWVALGKWNGDEDVQVAGHWILTVKITK